MSSDGSDIHFFKRIEENTLRNGELRIPRSFVSKCWEGISNPVLILLPNGAKWEVKWKNLNADVWLIDSWKKFAEFYSLDQDHLLVFRYGGKSQFQVVILDQSGVEMEYPLKEGTLDGEENGNSSRQSKRAKSPLPYSPSTKKVKTNPRKETSRGGRKIMHGNRGCTKSKAIQSEKLSALDRAKSFYSNNSNNPIFIREMKPSYIRRSILVMPGNFITEQQRKEGNSVTLRTREDRTWIVKYCLNRCNGQITLSAGWKDFAKDNNLKTGDVCIFEHIKSRGLLFTVYILRDGEESSPCMFPAYGNRAGRQNSIAERDSENPRWDNEMTDNHFTLSIKNNQLHHESIPMELISNHDIDNVNDVTLRVGKRSWPVRISKA